MLSELTTHFRVKNFALKKRVSSKPATQGTQADPNKLTTTTNRMKSGRDDMSIKNPATKDVPLTTEEKPQHGAIDITNPRKKGSYNLLVIKEGSKKGWKKQKKVMSKMCKKMGQAKGNVNGQSQPRAGGCMWPISQKGMV